MRRRGLLVCTAAVLLAHGALFGVLTAPGLRLARGAPPAQDAGHAGRLVLLDRDQVAFLALSSTGPLTVLRLPENQAEQRVQQAVADVAGASASDVDPGAHAARSRPSATLYRSPAQLDQPARTRSAPDLSLLNGLSWSGLPIRLRLFIDTSGTVVDTQVLQSGEAEDVVERVRQMFLATGFTAGTVHGQQVPSYKDIEILVGNPPAAPATQ